MINQANSSTLGHTGEPTVVHTIKNQMTIVKGWTQLAAGYPTQEWQRHEEEVRRSLASIDAAATRITALLEQIQLGRAECQMTEVVTTVAGVIRTTDLTSGAHLSTAVS